MHYTDPNKQTMAQESQGPFVNQQYVDPYAQSQAQQQQYPPPNAGGGAPYTQGAPYVDPASIQHQQPLPPRVQAKFIDFQELKSSIRNNQYPVSILRVQGIVSILIGIILFILNIVFSAEGYGYYFIYFGFITDIICLIDGIVCLSITKPMNQTLRGLVNVRNSYISLNILLFIDLVVYGIGYSSINRYYSLYLYFNKEALAATIAFTVIFFVINCVFCYIIYNKITVMFPTFRGFMYTNQPTVVIVQQQQQPVYP